ncbi:MAG: hypothetical protein ACTSXD_05135 [Candidatus Heimdallarchaeaceae archaeon]
MEQIQELFTGAAMRVKAMNAEYGTGSISVSIVYQILEDLENGIQIIYSNPEQEPTDGILLRENWNRLSYLSGKSNLNPVEKKEMRVRTELQNCWSCGNRNDKKMVIRKLKELRYFIYR